jgi:magnesium transporter
MLVDEAVYVGGRRQEGHDPAGTGGFSWVGIHDPTLRELESYRHHFHFNDLALEDAVSFQQRPKLDFFDGHNFLVVRTVAFVGPGRPLSLGDVSVFFSGDAVVTVRHGEVMPLATIRGDLESRPDRMMEGPIVVVHELVDRLVDQYVAVAAALADDVRRIEDHVFGDGVPAPTTTTYQVKRELIEFRRAVMPLLEPLTTLAQKPVPFVSENFRFRFSDVRDHLLKVIDDLDSMERIIDATLQANLALISVRQNEDMRKISAWVGIGAVPTMIAGIYGMNFENMPELDTSMGYFAVLALMGSICGLLFWLFRRNNWL